MGRPPRPTEDGLVFHALNRGNNRGDVFFDDGDRSAYLDALAKTKERDLFRTTRNRPQSAAQREAKEG